LPIEALQLSTAASLVKASAGTADAVSAATATAARKLPPKTRDIETGFVQSEVKCAGGNAKPSQTEIIAA
jgi:hypothetical protein